MKWPQDFLHYSRANKFFLVARHNRANFGADSKLFQIYSFQNTVHYYMTGFNKKPLISNSFFHFRKEKPFLKMFKGTNIVTLLNYTALSPRTISYHKELCSMKLKVHHKLPRFRTNSHILCEKLKRLFNFSDKVKMLGGICLHFSLENIVKLNSLIL